MEPSLAGVLSVVGIHLGDDFEKIRQAAGALLKQNTPTYWSWGDFEMKNARLDKVGGTVESVWRTSLEKDGQVIVRQGDDSSVVLQALGDPDEQMTFSPGSPETHYIYNQPGFQLDITVTNLWAAGSSEHEQIFASGNVVDRVFHIGITQEM